AGHIAHAKTGVKHEHRRDGPLTADAQAATENLGTGQCQANGEDKQQEQRQQKQLPQFQLALVGEVALEQKAKRGKEQMLRFLPHDQMQQNGDPRKDQPSQHEGEDKCHGSICISWSRLPTCVSAHDSFGFSSTSQNRFCRCTRYSMSALSKLTLVSIAT